MRILLAALIPACAAAQSLTEAPPFLQLVRKPGTAKSLARPYQNAGAAINVLGMTAVTGLPETWFLETHYNWASIEDLDKGLAAVGFRSPDPIAAPMEDELLAPSRTILAAFRPAWSYRADQAIRQFPRARYFYITIYRIRAGTESDFGEMIRLRRLNQDSVNLDRPDIAYSVISGAPSGTFIFVAPIVTLRTFDDGVADTPAWAAGLVDAQRAIRKSVAPDSEISREHLLFRVEPRLSYVSDSFTSGDSKFWRGEK